MKHTLYSSLETREFSNNPFICAHHYSLTSFSSIIIVPSLVLTFPPKIYSNRPWLNVLLGERFTGKVFICLK